MLALVLVQGRLLPGSLKKSPVLVLVQVLVLVLVQVCLLRTALRKGVLMLILFLVLVQVSLFQSLLKRLRLWFWF